MTILSIYAHHEPSSLTASLKNAAEGVLTRQGHTLLESDLYGTGFSPKAERFDFINTSGKHFNYMMEQKNTATNGMGFAPDIVAEFEKIASADIILFHMPLWWQGPPAILKGWFDRVLAMGVAWDAGKIYDKGLLRGKAAMLCVSVGYPEEFYAPTGLHKASMEQILHPVQYGTLAYCGLDIIEPFVIYNSLGLNEAAIRTVLEEYSFKIETLTTSPTYLTRFTG